MVAAAAGVAACNAILGMDAPTLACPAGCPDGSTDEGTPDAPPGTDAARADGGWSVFDDDAIASGKAESGGSL